MSKVAFYLQEHLLGEVMTSSDAKSYFSTDNSILSIDPLLVVYPRNENDVRKTARFVWQLAERGKIIPITARGAGTDQTGAAIGSGMILAFTAHMYRILEFDSKTGMVKIEPGINFGKLQQSLHTHGRFLPPMPSSGEYSTVGGAVANNASGSNLVKYGDFKNYVSKLRVVLANGEVIVTGRLSARELNKKLGLTTFEGKIYRNLDTLVEEEIETIRKQDMPVVKNNAGYNLIDIKRKDGSFDLTPLFIGSQGTLGIVTEIEALSANYNPETVLLMAFCDNTEQLQNIVQELKELPSVPSSIEVVDGNLLSEAVSINPNALTELIEKPYPSFVVFVEFDIAAERQLKKMIKKANKILSNHASNVRIEYDKSEQDKLWKIRDTSSYVMSHNNESSRSIPLIGGGAVPINNLAKYIDGIYKLFEKTTLPPAIWGHIGDGIVHLQPRLDIAQVGDRQKVFRLIEDYVELVKSLGGTISGEGNDGRLFTPSLHNVYPTELLDLFVKVKNIFDPYNLLNPGIKFDTTTDDLKNLLRHEYKLSKLYDHLPRN